MRKFTSIALGAVLALSMSATVFADTDYTDQATATLYKTYTLTNEGTTSPAETFSFSALTCTSVTNAADDVTTANAPVPTIANVSFAAGEAGTTKPVTITLPEYTSVGVYTYSFNEIAGSTEGVTYRTTPMKLVVTVLNDENGLIRVAGVHAEKADSDVKTDTFDENTYSAGTLEVTKDVTGNLGDKTKNYEVQVVFTAEEGTTVNSAITYTNYKGETETIDPSDWSESGVYALTFDITDGSTVSFANIPYGVTYTVKESDYSSEGYTTTYTSTDTDSVVNSASETVTITNDKGIDEPDTGLYTDMMPYVVVIGAAACAGAVFFVSRRRKSNED